MRHHVYEEIFKELDILLGKHDCNQGAEEGGCRFGMKEGSL